MNGPRTNQLVAPTSFITSISRRREKIESRIVFAIRSAAEVSRIAHRDREDRLDPVREMEDAVRVLGVVDHLFHARRDRMQARVERIQVLGLLRRDDERVGERVERQRLQQRAFGLLHLLVGLLLGDELERADERVALRAPARRRSPARASPRRPCRSSCSCRSSRRARASRGSTRRRVQVPSAISSPSRNIPISTVIIAAKVVEMLAPRLRQASETSKPQPHSPV